MNKVQMEIHNANKAMVKAVREDLDAVMNSKVTDEDIMNINSEAFLTVWLTAKGLLNPDVDCTKGTNAYVSKELV